MMTWMLIAIVVVLIVAAESGEDDLDRSKLLKELRSLKQRLNHLVKVGAVQNKSRDEPKSSEDAREAQFRKIIKDILKKLNYIDVPVSELTVRQVGRDIKKATNLLLDEYIKDEQCKLFVLVELFIGCMSHTLGLDMDPQNPLSMYNVVSMWAAMPNQTALSDFDPADIVNPIFRPAIDIIDNFTAKLGVVEKEDDFFNATATYFQTLEDHPNKTHFTLRTVLTHYLPCIRMLEFNNPNNSTNCSTLNPMVELSDMTTQLITHLMGVLYSSNFANVTDTVGLSEEQQHSLYAFINMNYEVPNILKKTVHALYQDEMDPEHFVKTFAFHFVEIYFGRLILEEAEHLLAAEVVDLVKFGSSIDMSIPTIDVPSSDRIEIMSMVWNELLSHYQQQCPTIVLAKFVLGFANFTNIHGTFDAVDLFNTFQTVSDELNLPYKASVHRRMRRSNHLQSPCARQSPCLMNPTASAVHNKEACVGGSCAHRGKTNYYYSQEYDDIPLTQEGVFFLLLDLPRVFMKRMHHVFQGLLATLEYKTAAIGFWLMEMELYTGSDPTFDHFDDLLIALLDRFLPAMELQEVADCVHPYTILDHLSQRLFTACTEMDLTYTPLNAKEVHDTLLDLGILHGELTIGNIEMILGVLHSRLEARMAAHSEYLCHLAELISTDNATEINAAMKTRVATKIDQLINSSIIFANGGIRKSNPASSLTEIVKLFEPAIRTSSLGTLSPAEVLSAFMTTFDAKASESDLDLTGLSDVMHNVMVTLTTKKKSNEEFLYDRTSLVEDP